ncbi:MAG: hypothetical protein GY856_06495 [bacterium]|nr:hypothetical protein [bacterium]
MSHPPAYAPLTVARFRARRLTLSATALKWLVALVAHVPLALLLKRSSQLSTLHALGTLALGILWATQRRRPDRAIYVTAYIAGAEILWRMTGADVFWEYGKYAITLMLGLLVLRSARQSRLSTLAVIYFLLLLPSCISTLDALGWSQAARGAISFNLSGPLSLAVAVMFFSGYRARNLRIDWLLQSMLLPITSVLALAIYSTLTAEHINFGTQANLVTSGGYGPNQVSAILGLGAVLALLLSLHSPDTGSRWIFAGLSALFLVQAVLTFSRGGVFNVAICVALLGLHYIRDRRKRRAFAVLFLVLAPIAANFVLPRLDAWTGGRLKERFQSFDTTGRKDIAVSELELWSENLVVGVGTGMSSYARSQHGQRKVAAHTEFTRLLAEHGSLGAVALLVLLYVGFHAYRAAPDVVARAWVAVLTGWAFTEMAHAAMRIAAISLLVGMATFRWARPSPPRISRRPTAAR